MIFQIKTLEKSGKKTRQQGYMPKNMHVEGRAMYQVSSSTALSLMARRKGLSVNQKLTNLPRLVGSHDVRRGHCFNPLLLRLQAHVGKPSF